MKKISVIIPCLNEEKYILGVLDNLVSQDYSKEYMEVFIVDGGSTDQTVTLINKFRSQYSWIHLLVNPERVVPPAMNLGIQRSSGDIVFRLDAHASYPSFYLSRLVHWLEKLDADNVGGMCITKPGSEGPKARAIARALSHPFGVGNSYFRIGVTEPREVDTVPFGCYKRQVFDKIGLYNLKLIRNQDIELNKRLKNTHGKIFLVPDVYCYYFARDTFDKLAINNYQNGRWVILTAWLTGTFSSLSLRHFIPFFFMSYLMLLSFLLMWSGYFLFPLILYLVVNAFFSIRVCFQSKDYLNMPAVFMSFLILHLSYGFGSLAGLAGLIFKRSKFAK